MKKLWIIVAVAGFLYSCGGNNPKVKTETEAQNEQKIVDIHNAQISLDYEGTYTAKMPSANGEGMIVTITLEKDNYVVTTEYIGKKGVFTSQGKYSWNIEGNIIILDGITDAPNKYFVGENALFQLDMDGNQITGEYADMYVLHKKP